MTKIMNIVSPSIADIVFNSSNITHNQMGIDTIRQIAHYSTVCKLVAKEGLKVVKPSKGSPVSQTIAQIEKKFKQDNKTRYKADKFVPIIEVVKLTKAKNVSNYMIIVRNTPLLFDVAINKKRAKDTFCMVIFTGLHQPTKKISSDAMKIVSKFTNRKAFKLYSLDIAIDTEDSTPLSYGRYENKVDHPRISKILFYDKYKKALAQQKKEKIGKDLKAWKRLEVTITFDVTKKQNKGFVHYIEGMNFIDDICEVHTLAQKVGIKSYEEDYLTYQLNSLLDNRMMNNQESKKQFNSVQSLERFKQSDFRRYVLAI